MSVRPGATRSDAGRDLDEWLRMALAEDLGERGDITSALALGGRGPAATGRIVAKESGRLSGLGPATRVFTLVDPQVALTKKLG
jgi:nicotinate-nucleotide pyrophosphorylase